MDEEDNRPSTDEINSLVLIRVSRIGCGMSAGVEVLGFRVLAEETELIEVCEELLGILGWAKLELSLLAVEVSAVCWDSMCLSISFREMRVEVTDAFLCCWEDVEGVERREDVELDLGSWPGLVLKTSL